MKPLTYRNSARVNRKALSVLIAFLAVFHALASAQRISVENNLFTVNSNRIWISGANTPWHRWNEFGHQFDYSWWDGHFRALRENGVNCTRVWISCSGDNASPGISGSGYVSGPTTQFWNDADALFEIARSHEIYLMIALISFDHSKPGNTNAGAWQNMYNSADTRASFVTEYAVPFVNRYRDNPYFFAVDVGNELEWAWENHGVPVGNVLDLIARVANAVHQHSEVLVCQGLGAGPKYNSPDYEGNYFTDEALSARQSGAYVDFYNIHCYDWQIQYFSSPFDRSPSGYGMDEKPGLVGELPARGVAGYSPQQCYQRAFELGWQGIMPWTSNGVDGNGGLDDMGPGSNWFDDNHPGLVRPAITSSVPPSRQRQFRAAVSSRRNGAFMVEFTGGPAGQRKHLSIYAPDGNILGVRTTYGDRMVLKRGDFPSSGMYVLRIAQGGLVTCSALGFR